MGGIETARTSCIKLFLLNDNLVSFLACTISHLRKRLESYLSLYGVFAGTVKSSHVVSQTMLYTGGVQDELPLLVGRTSICLCQVPRAQ
jgi:hypothetical protein